MTIYQEQFTVSLTVSEWLRVNISLYDAVDHYSECRGYPQTAIETRNVLNKIRAATQRTLDLAHEEVMHSLKEKKIIEEFGVMPTAAPPTRDGIDDAVDYSAYWKAIGEVCPTCHTKDPYGHEAGCEWLHETPWIPR